MMIYSDQNITGHHSMIQQSTHNKDWYW